MNNKRQKLSGIDPERVDTVNPAITVEELRRARPAREVLPQYIGQKATTALLARRPGRPKQTVRKVNQTLRIDPDVLVAYRQAGPGWQTRMNRVLRDNMPA